MPSKFLGWNDIVPKKFLLTEKNEPNHDQHRQHERYREPPNVLQKRWHFDLFLLSNGFDHEIRTVAQVRVRAKKHCANADGQDVSAECQVPEQEGHFNFL